MKSFYGPFIINYSLTELILKRLSAFSISFIVLVRLNACRWWNNAIETNTSDSKSTFTIKMFFWFVRFSIDYRREIQQSNTERKKRALRTGLMVSTFFLLFFRESHKLFFVSKSWKISAWMQKKKERKTSINNDVYLKSIKLCDWPNHSAGIDVVVICVVQV